MAHYVLFSFFTVFTVCLILPLAVFVYCHFFEYGNYDKDLYFNTTGMASPYEPNRGRFSGLKNWWSGKSNQPLSPLETNQKTLNTLQKAQDSTLGHCKKHDDLLIDNRRLIEPPSHTIMTARRDKCYFHCNALSKCVHQIYLDVART